MNQETRIGFLPPTTTDGHRRPPSSTTTPSRNNRHCSASISPPLNFHNPSPPSKISSYTSPSSASSPENSGTGTPASKIAAILGRAISMMPSTSFEEVTAATAGNTFNQLHRTLSDPTSIVYQEPATITTPPPRAPPATIRRTVSDISSFARQAGQRTTTTPPRVPRQPLLPGERTISPSPKPRKVAPESSNSRETPQSKRLKRLEQIMEEIKERCWEVFNESEEDEQEEENEAEAAAAEDVQDDCPHNNDETPSQEESVALEWQDDGLRIQLNCPCAQGFEIMLKQNGCFCRRLP